MHEPSVKMTQLPNGLRLATQEMPMVRSVSFGIWITVGSRHEEEHEEGIAHLWEHLAFKGTPKRSALAIAKNLDRLGGLSNAFTDRETTCYFARVVDSGVQEAFDIMADIALNTTLDSKELELEKRVIFQEIAMVNDSPEEYVHEHLWRAVWKDRSVAHSILGSPRVIADMDAASLSQWKKGSYGPENIVITACGSVRHDDLLRMVVSKFDQLHQGVPAKPKASPLYNPRHLAFEREAEQNHILLSFPSSGAGDDRRFVNACISSLLGGQMSSRLFQEVREKRGLAYTVYSTPHLLSDGGLLQIYAGAGTEKTAELLHVIRNELERLAAGDVTYEELEHVRQHLTGLLLLGAESTEDRMMRLAKNMILFNRPVSYDETASNLSAVTLDDIRTAAATMFKPHKASLAVLGPDIDPDWATIWDAQFE